MDCTLRQETVSLRSKDEFSKLKLAMSLDYIFGRGISKKIDYSEIRYEYSRKTGRLRYVLDLRNNKILFSFRPNGSISPTIEAGKMLISKPPKRLSARPRYCVTVLDGVSDLVSQGKTVFCKHVVSCDKSLRAGEDVFVLNEKGEFLAVGRTVVPCAVVKQFKRGVAVKVREGTLSKSV